ncbi:MAG: hypothetical protein JWR07_3752 [Nevskia sp.]|nr:hypothetical protein [Nevskia sp.]
MKNLVSRVDILDAFPLHPVPAYRLSDAIAEDDYGDRRSAFDEHWETWDQIESWQIARSAAFFSYAPPAAAAYLAPRFMLYVLDEISGSIDASASDSGDFFIWWLQRLRRTNFSDSRFTAKQISIIELFLAQLGGHPDYQIVLEVGGE